MSNNETDYYVKLPNLLFFTYTDVEQSILQLIKDNKVFLLIDYLYTNTNRKNISSCTIEDIVTTYGYKLNTRKGKICDKIKDILVKLKELKLIDSDLDFNKITYNQLVKCQLNIFPKSDSDKDYHFVLLTDTERNKIVNQNYKDNLKILIYYCYLKARMFKRARNDDIEANGGRAEVTFLSYKTISGDLGLSDKTIKKYNDLLVDIDLIRIGNAGLWYYADDKNKTVKESPNFYTLFKDGWELQLKEAIKFYKSKTENLNKIFDENRNYKNNNRKLNGKLGAIIKKERNGTATVDDVKLKNEIIEFTNVNAEQKYKIKALLVGNPDEPTLSAIYFANGKDRLAEEYEALEHELGLVDKNDNLTVSRDYYQWVVMNYTKEQHDFYVNCVKKYKRENGIENDSKTLGIPKEKFNNNKTIFEDWFKQFEDCDY